MKWKGFSEETKVDIAQRFHQRNSSDAMNQLYRDRYFWWDRLCTDPMAPIRVSIFVDMHRSQSPFQVSNRTGRNESLFVDLLRGSDLLGFMPRKQTFLPLNLVEVLRLLRRPLSSEEYDEVLMRVHVFLSAAWSPWQSLCRDIESELDQQHHLTLRMEHWLDCTALGWRGMERETEEKAAECYGDSRLWALVNESHTDTLMEMMRVVRENIDVDKTEWPLL